MDKSNIFDLGSILDKNIQKPDLPPEQHATLDMHKLKTEPVYIQSNPLLYKSKQPFSQKLKMLNVNDPNTKMRSTGIRTSATIDPLIYKEVPRNEWLLLPTNTYIRVLYNDNSTSAGGRMASLSPVGDGTYAITIRHKNPKNFSTSLVNTDDINKLYKLINDKKEMQKGISEMPTIHEMQNTREPIREPIREPMREPIDMQPVQQNDMQPIQQTSIQTVREPIRQQNETLTQLRQIQSYPQNSIAFNDTNESISSLNFRVDTIEIKIQRIEQSINKIIELIKERIVK
jgi:hypothetical protein